MVKVLELRYSFQSDDLKRPRFILHSLVCLNGYKSLILLRNWDSKGNCWAEVAKYLDLLRTIEMPM